MPDTRTVCRGPLRPALAPGIAARAAELYCHDAQFRDCLPRPEVISGIRCEGLGLGAIIAAVMTGYADRPALGRCGVAGSATEIISYSDLWDRIQAIAADWRGHPEYPLASGDFVCTLGFASADYATVDLACALAGAVSAPVQAGQLSGVLAETGASVLAVSADQLPTALEAVHTAPKVRRLIVFDHRSDSSDARRGLRAARRRLAQTRSPILLQTLDEVIRNGRRQPQIPAPAAADPDRLVGLSYTSGSTGQPKAAMYTERMVANTWRNCVAIPVISYNYMPMSHYGGKALVLTTLASGGTAYFASAGDMSTLFDDLAAVRPTVLPLIPRVSEMFLRWYQREYSRRLVPDADPAVVREQVMAELRENVLGGRLLLAASGSAPLSAELTEFVESCLHVHLAVGYGTTETGNVLSDGRVVRPPVTDYKLLDVPELGYFGTDRPHPRGELLVKSEMLSPGYYRRPDATETAFDDEGYYHTGDIMAEIAPDHLTFVDRRTNVVKLSQGEFVAVSALESVYVTSPYVRQIFVYASGERAFVLAVVVPEQLPGRSAPTKTTILESLQRIARDKALRPYEVPRDILIEPAGFSGGNGLLTATGKPARPALTARYRDRLEQAYTDIADRQSAELAALRRDAKRIPVCDTVCRAAAATLGIPGIDADTVLGDLGVDSLAALTLTTLLADLFGVTLAPAAVIDPGRTPAGIAALITAACRGTGRRSCAAAHGRSGDQVYVGDLTLDRFIETGTLDRAARCPRAADPKDPPRTVLLTGANGFLGQALCDALQFRLRPIGGTLICLVRGTELEGPARSRPEVITGDLGAERLGLDPETWTRLTATVDLIVHAGALVNHLLSYSQLFGPNVHGTAELVRLAITGRAKNFAYVSTAAAGTTDGGRPLAEDVDIRVGCPGRARNTAPANGYVISKWAGEVLLRQAHERCGLPVTVFRPAMILAHSRVRDRINVGDVFTRLVLSMAATGIAPRSFYREPAIRPHYDALPVDFVAEAIVALATGPAPAGGFVTYNVVNDHDDAVSLDVVVDWLTAAGCAITRIESHRDWATRFESAMRSLPPRQRTQSLLPLMAAFTEPAEAIAGSAFPSQRFRAGLQATDTVLPVPHLTPALVQGYLTALRRRRLL